MSAKRSGSRILKCECGGSLEKALLETYDFSDYVGLPVTIRRADGFRCDKCGEETIPGELVNQVMNHLVVSISQQPRRLICSEARYLRHFLEITQEELAIRMGIARETVAKWECDDTEISAQHDFILRVIALNDLVVLGLVAPEIANRIVGSTFGAVRSAPPPRTITNLDFDQQDVFLTNRISPIEPLASAG